jgi:hypothetical protein
MTRAFEAKGGERIIMLLHGLTSRGDRWRQTVPARATAVVRSCGEQCAPAGRFNKADDIRLYEQGLVDLDIPVTSRRAFPS